MTGGDLAAVCGVGAMVAAILGMLPFFYLVGARNWPPRPAAAIWITLMDLGPIGVVAMAPFNVLIIARFVVRGLREAWRLWRGPFKPSKLPRAKAVRS